MKTKYTKEFLEDAMRSCHSYRDFIIKSGRNPSGGESYRVLKNKLIEFGLDNSLTKETGKLNRKRSFATKEDILVKDSKYTQKQLREFIKKNKILVYECSICGSEGENWEGSYSLELDHINGDNSDNRIENLRYLCPVCHAQTPTYRGKNKRRKNVN